MNLALRLLYETTMARVSGSSGLKGFVTEAHLHLAEPVFPGITDFYRAGERKPETFLELVWRFERRENSALPALEICCSPRSVEENFPLSLLP